MGCRGTIDIVTDIILLISLTTIPFYFGLFLTTLVSSLVANTIILFYILHDELQENSDFRKWYTKNFGAAKIILTLACFDIQIVRIIDSGVFGINATSTSFSNVAERKLNVATSVSILIENIPQCILQVVIWSDYHLVSPDNRLLRENLPFAISLSVIDILSSVIGLLFSYPIAGRKTDIYIRMTVAGESDYSSFNGSLFNSPMSTAETAAINRE